MSIPAERLREGQQILIRGKVSFSRLAKLIDGDDLVRSIAQARQRGGLYPTTRPHTTVNLLYPQILAANPAALTPEEQFVQEKIFIFKTGENTGKPGYGVDNVSKFLPTILEMDPDNPGQYRQLVLQRDLASGVDVTLVLQVFKPKDHEKRGIGLQQVVLNEPVRYYASSGVDTEGLAARGITVTGGVRPVVAAESTAAVAAPVAYAPDVAMPANSQVNASGFAAPMPGAQGIVPAPSLATQMFPQSVPAAAPAAQAPVAYVPPVAQAPASYVPPVAAAPVAYAAPVAPAAPAPVAPAAPAAASETPDETIARLQQQIVEQNAAKQGSGGGSPFDTQLVGVGAPAAPGPWNVPGQPAATYQG